MPYKLFKLNNSPYWYVDFGLHQGRRLRPSPGTEDKREAEAYAKHRQAEIWREEKLGERPSVTWDYAVIEWLKAHAHKKDLEHDKLRLRELSKHFRGTKVDRIDAADLRMAAESLPGIAPSTRNRYMAAGSAILNFAFAKQWRANRVSIHRFQETSQRIRYLTPLEASRLLDELPSYLRTMAEFSLATGLRESNVRLLEWPRVDLVRSIALDPWRTNEGWQEPCSSAQHRRDRHSSRPVGST